MGNHSHRVDRLHFGEEQAKGRVAHEDDNTFPNKEG
ncbi:uncharacterized protein G2W53_003854 [Senna tora]|uniref:Uncharacterized protein n=1 Tax=Senna tora TaxID=362788 RepID=A0A835CG48_9FABA|nr:uncharacterized protein G2W53_003854 [Senna tora]